MYKAKSQKKYTLPKEVAQGLKYQKLFAELINSDENAHLETISTQLCREILV